PLLQQLGSTRDPPALAAVQRLLHAAFANHDGHEVDTASDDSCVAAFARAPDAVACAAEVQRALAAHLWPTGGTVRLRMGLYTGVAQVVGDRDVGLEVQRAARIAAAGHGGHVLLSQTVHDLVEDALPEGAALRDLGAHRLKDLLGPEQLWQLVLPDVPG